MQEVRYNDDIAAMLAVLQARVAELEVLTESSFVQASSGGMLTGLNPQVWNDIEWSFKLRINQNGRLIRSAGWRCVIDNPWEYVPEADHGSATPNMTVAFVYTYGDPVGTWTEWVGNSSSIPSTDETKFVIPLGTVMANNHYGHGPFWIMHRHIGDIAVLNILNCQ